MKTPTKKKKIPTDLTRLPQGTITHVNNFSCRSGLASEFWFRCLMFTLDLCSCQSLQLFIVGKNTTYLASSWLSISGDDRKGRAGSGREKEKLSRSSPTLFSIVPTDRQPGKDDKHDFKYVCSVVVLLVTH